MKRDLAKTRIASDFPEQHQLSVGTLCISALLNVCVCCADRSLSFFLVMHGIDVFIAVFYDPSIPKLGQGGEDFTFNSHRLLWKFENIPLKITIFLFRHDLTNEFTSEAQYGAVCERQGLLAVRTAHQRLLSFIFLMLGRLRYFAFSATGNEQGNEKGWYDVFFHDDLYGLIKLMLKVECN